MSARRPGIEKSLRAASALLVGCLLMAACSEPGLPPLDADARILAFGDSLTHGTGADADAAYPARLARRLGRQVIESGRPGELASEGRRRLQAVLERVQPDLVVLCHGGNDILRGRDPSAIRRDLVAMIELAQDHGAAVLLVGVPARGLFTDTADFYYEVAETTGVPLEDEVLEEIIVDPSLKSDRVHPNAAGYARMAEAVHAALAAAGAVAPAD